MPPPTSPRGISHAIEAHLTGLSLPPAAPWVRSLTATTRPHTPLPALLKTAEYRLLHTDITATVQATARSTFPAGIASPDVSELRVPGPVPVQVLDVEDVARSRWSQVEALEMEARGETQRGHEVIRVVAETAAMQEERGETENGTAATTGGRGPHKLLLQDCTGTTVYAFDTEPVPGAGDLAIGGKMVLTDFVVARGVVLLTPRATRVLGGKVDAWDHKWRADRMTRLKQKAGRTEAMDGQ